MDNDQIEIRYLGDLARIELKPGDVFVLSCEQRISSETAERVRAYWQRVMGDVPLLIFDGGARLEVVPSAPSP